MLSAARRWLESFNDLPAAAPAAFVVFSVPFVVLLIVAGVMVIIFAAAVFIIVVYLYCHCYCFCLLLLLQLLVVSMDASSS